MNKKINSAFTVADDILLHLIDRMNEATGYPSAGETIEGNLVSLLPNDSESGDGNNQLSGYDGLRGLSNDVVDVNDMMYIEITYSAPDATISIYKDSGLGAGDLVGHTASYAATGLVAVIEDNSSGLRGTLTVDSVGPASASVVVTWSVGGTRTGTGRISALTASQMAEADDVIIQCINADTEGSEQWRIRTRTKGPVSGNPGLVTTAVAFPASGVQDKTGIEVTITGGGVAFIVGDRFELKTASDDVAIFQTFFREYFTRILPNVLDGTETIADSLAE